MKLYYKVKPEDYRECMDKVRAKFGMHEEIDEEKTILRLDDQERIERIIGSYNPSKDEMAHIRVILEDNSLKQYFNSIFGEPYKEKR